MEEKKQTGKWSYSALGKCIRGILCMLTFCAFAAGMVFLAFGIRKYGIEIINMPKADYYGSEVYKKDISNEVVSLLNSLSRMYESGEKTEISITDVEKGIINYYDCIAVMKDGDQKKNGDDIMENMDDYKIKSLDCGFDFYKYDQVLEYFESDLPENNFLYFSNDAFKNLFIKNGYRNTDHQFSDEFSEYAYFVFKNIDTGDSTSKEDGAAEEASIYLDYGSTGEAPAYSISATTSVEGKEVTVNQIMAVTKDTLDNFYYAVYDPDRDLYYSTGDEYFQPMDSYIYDSKELKSMLEGGGNVITDFIFPVLSSQNINTEGVWSYLNSKFSAINEEAEKLNQLENSVFCYSVRNSLYYRKNVHDISDITGLKYAYRLTGKGVDVVKANDMLQDVKELVDYDLIEEAFSALPQDTVFYFGIDPGRETEDAASQLVQNNREYSFFSSGRYVVGISIAVFILLLLQAVSLIRTTGRNGREDKVIILNYFDRLATEIWILLYVGILLGSVFFAVLTAEHFYYSNLSINQTLFLVVLGTIPFGFFFMELALSFARRIKAQNMWNCSYLRKMTGKPELVSSGVENGQRVEQVSNVFTRILENGITACRRYFQNLKGTKKLLLAFVCYVLLELLSLYIIIIRPHIGLGMFFLLQIVAFAAVIYVMRDIENLINGVKEITKGSLDYKVTVNGKASLFTELGDGINHIGDGLKEAIETSLKDERMKTELITNVSHDLKTPLTSIINYINLLKTEKMPTPEAEHYVEVLDSKAQRLKHLTEDLVEAAKATSGNIELEKMPLAFDELMKQAFGEFEDKFAKRQLTVITHYPEKPAVVLADGRRMYRIIENVLQNAYKYAYEGTRIYADLSNKQDVVTFTLKNISAAPLNISSEELMERFTRGDSARTTEGSGLGLSIAKDLTRLQGGTFDIVLDGDLFKVIISFPEYVKNQDLEQ